MNNRLEELARRKEALVQRCAQDRIELARSLSRVRSPLHFRTFLLAAGKMLKAYPVTVAGLSSLVVSGYVGTLTKSAVKLLSGGRMIQPVWSWWSKRRR